MYIYTYIHEYMCVCTDAALLSARIQLCTARVLLRYIRVRAPRSYITHGLYNDNSTCPIDI